MKDNWVLGISCSHNGSAALLKNDEIVVAIQEERLSRQKRQQVYGSQPILSVKYCLDYAGIQPQDLAMVVNCTPRYATVSTDDIFLNPMLRVQKNGITVESIPHHLGHAIGAFVLSGFDEASILVIDGIGSPEVDLTDDDKKVAVEIVDNGWEIISMYKADRKNIYPLEKHLVANGDWLSMDVNKMKRFGSLGGMFSAVAAQIFGDVLEAGKVMGLAPYGKPIFPVEDFFRIENNRFIFTNKITNYFQRVEKWPFFKEEYENLSASVQNALEQALYHLVNRLFYLSSNNNFCYTGGVALNSVANDKLLREFKIDNYFIQPEAEDSGTAIGAAFYGYWKLKGEFPKKSKLKADHRGKTYTRKEIDIAIESTQMVEVHSCNDIIHETVELLCQGKIIGLFNGGSELGPRALGHRSILCDPRIPDAKDILNQKVKHRESFRPFAPVILQKEAHNWFVMDKPTFESPFMLRVCQFREDKLNSLPAVTHVDGTGRVQTMTKEIDIFFNTLIEEFFKKTGVPILVNTSFNIMGEPIVETPEDALYCLLGTDIDYVVFENCIVKKKNCYKSILDLIPYITAKRYNIHNLVENGITNPSENEFSFISFVVDSPWGEIRQITGITLLPLLKLIDGKRSGKELFSSLESNIEDRPEYLECIKKWEGIAFGESDETQDYTLNSNMLIDNVSYPRLIASTVYNDYRQIKNENDFMQMLLRLKRAGIISFS